MSQNLKIKHQNWITMTKFLIKNQKQNNNNNAPRSPLSAVTYLKVSPKRVHRKRNY